MMKVGRNKPCPCGSGKKFKHCHGSVHAASAGRGSFPVAVEAAVQRKLRELKAERVQREKQQGLGRGIISAEVHGYRIVAVGSTVLYSNRWGTFHDFLRDYLIDRLGRAWFKAEQAKPQEKQHPIVRWYDKAIAGSKLLGVKVGEIVSSPMTGAQQAFLNLAYNIYLIAHHAEPLKAGALLTTFIDKLKSERSDDFIGKLFETYAAAAFLKAGFDIAYEDESKGGTSKVEFVATFPETGKKFSVEVKSRNRTPTEDGPVDDIKRLRIATKLNKALAKSAEHARVVMIEINVPDVLTAEKLQGWPRAALDQIRHAEKSAAPDGTEKPRAYVVVTNHAFHNNLDAVSAGAQILAAGCCIPDFGPDVAFWSLKQVLESKVRHREMFALLESMRTHYDIPSTFNGENPDLAFVKDGAPSRLKFGEWYAIPGPDGIEMPAQLMDATIDERTKMTTGIYRVASGNAYLVTCPLTDAELAAWKRHPDTFFGEVRNQTRNVENWLELAELMHETYQNTSREKLLDWMKDASDIAELLQLSQADLAIAYCERVAWGSEVAKRKRLSDDAAPVDMVDTAEEP